MTWARAWGPLPSLARVIPWHVLVVMLTEWQGGMVEMVCERTSVLEKAHQSQLIRCSSGNYTGGTRGWKASQKEGCTRTLDSVNFLI